jgi:hypothetical protein
LKWAALLSFCPQGGMTPAESKTMPSLAPPKAQLVAASFFQLCILALMIGLAGILPARPANAAEPQLRFVRIDANLYVDPVSDLLKIAQAAKAAGANAIVFDDFKATSYSSPEYVAQREQWLKPMRQLRDGIRALGLKLIITAFATGYCGGAEAHDVTITTGYPLKNAPMIVRNNQLAAIPTAKLINGSFENYAGNDPDWWNYQDAPGAATFIDTAIVKTGRASLRFDSAGAVGGQTRIFADMPVTPFQQYRLRFWVRTENLTVDYLGPYISRADGTRSLTAQEWSTSAPNGERTYFSRGRQLNLGWTEMRIAFNSLDSNRITIALGAWGVTSGRMWVDDVRLETVPLLNLIRRPDLPLTVRTSSGTLLREGIDVARLSDPLLGKLPYSGSYDTYHNPLAIGVPVGSRLRDGDTVKVNGYHALVTAKAAASCSWNSPRTAAIARRIFKTLEADINPDGYLFNIDEVRTGGFEPADEAYPSSAAALAAHATRIARIIRSETGHKPYVWCDMFDPEMNAVKNYYQVAGTLERAGNLISPADMVIVNWKDANAATWDAASAQRSVKYFAGRGFTQVIAGFYDYPVGSNHRLWQAAIAGMPRIAGSMYTTWQSNYSQIARFGSLWW